MKLYRLLHGYRRTRATAWTPYRRVLRRWANGLKKRGVEANRLVVESREAKR